MAAPRFSRNPPGCYHSPLVSIFSYIAHSRPAMTTVRTRIAPIKPLLVSTPMHTPFSLRKPITSVCWIKSNAVHGYISQSDKATW